MYYLRKSDIDHRVIILALFTSKNKLKCMKKTVPHEGMPAKSEDPSHKENRAVQNQNCSLPTDYNFN